MNKLFLIIFLLFTINLLGSFGWNIKEKRVYVGVNYFNMAPIYQFSISKFSTYRTCTLRKISKENSFNIGINKDFYELSIQKSSSYLYTGFWIKKHFFSACLNNVVKILANHTEKTKFEMAGLNTGIGLISFNTLRNFGLRYRISFNYFVGINHEKKIELNPNFDASIGIPFYTNNKKNKKS